ncbi:ilvE [Symbiodinium sp. CCMP2456]|nr:ilvE [Symbiodinium sp. CCMP2456]
MPRYRVLVAALLCFQEAWAYAGTAAASAGSALEGDTEEAEEAEGMPKVKDEGEEEPKEAIPAGELARMVLVTTEDEDSQTYEQAQESCQSLEKNGDSWHLCFKDEVERDWKEYMLKASGAYGFRAWLDERNFSEAGCIHNGRRTEANAEGPNWACGYQKDKKFNSLCCVDMADVSVRTAGNMNVQNFSQAEATCTAYRSHLCAQAEAESFVANLGLGSTWVAWGAKGCTLEAAKKNWTCGDDSTQASQYDALCCLDQDPLKGLWPNHLGDLWSLQDRADCSNKLAIADGACEDFNGQLSACGSKLENRSGLLVHCAVDVASGTCRTSAVRCLSDTCVGACSAVR